MPRRYDDYEPRTHDLYSTAPSTSRYERRGSAPVTRSGRYDDTPRRPVMSKDDSYYDPRDKYYLSGDDGEEHGFRASSRSRDSPRRSSPPSRAGSSDRHRESERWDPRASSSSQQYAPSRSSRSGAGARGREERERYYPPSSSRNKDSRAGKRPGASRTNSSQRSSGGSNRSVNSKTEPQKKENGVLSSAMRVALEAGAVAALKQRHDPSPWIGMKGTKVAAAAIGAAAIDTFMERKAPQRKGGISHAMMRQATTMALGNLVLGPAAKGTVMGRVSK